MFRILLYTIIFYAFTSSFIAKAQNPNSNNQVDPYNPLQVDEEKIAKLPVVRLKSYLENSYAHLIKEVFSNDSVCAEFYNRFGMRDNNGKINNRYFINNFFEFNIKSAKSQSNNVLTNYLIVLEIRKDGNPSKSVNLNCNSVYNSVAKQYFISDISYSGTIDLPNNLVVIPPIYESPCINSQSGFSFIRLKNRPNVSSPEEPNLILGENAIEEIINPTSDGLQGNVFSQLPFDKFADDKDAPNPGFVISISDLREHEMKDVNDNFVDLFSNIYDGTGAFILSDIGGNPIFYPTGIFLDKGWKRIMTLTKSEENPIKAITGFVDPVSVKIIGNFLYVLDKGSNDIKIYRLFVFNDELMILFIGSTNFGLNLIGASDLTGFNTGNELVLYISNAYQPLLGSSPSSIYKLILDINTGVIKSGSGSPQILDQFVNINGQIEPLKNFSRIESSPRSGGRNVILAIDNNTVYSFSTDGTSSSNILTLLSKTNFPSISRSSAGYQPTNIGYNLGENSFYVTDYVASKIHIFSNEGFYLGSGGQAGTNESNNDLFFPNAISSNTFSLNNNEMVVVNRWSYSTGFKRLRPRPDVAELKVIEKAALNPSDILNNELNFRFSLSSGFIVNSIVLKLNGQIIKTLNSSNTTFFPNRYSNNFMANATGSNGLLGKLNAGWNTYQVTLNATTPEGANFQRVKSIEFYYIPSVISSNFIADISTSADITHDKSDNPFVIYKNLLVSSQNNSTINFTLQNGKILILKGCTLTVDKSVEFYAHNEDFEFECGSNLKMGMKENVAKRLINSKFNGTYTNYNMVSCWGDYTGGLEPGSASTSKLEFINCKFENYLGKALYVKEGRATIVNTTMQSTIGNNNDLNPALTAVGIVVDPNARVDIRGGKFLNNDIAIDASVASIYIGSVDKIYKDLNVEKPLFANNKIALHSFGSFNRIRHSDFKNNIAAIVDLNGTVDINEISSNIFENNTQGIIFSNTIFGLRGFNEFINNSVDITYLIPPEDINKTTFDLRCNYWEYSGRIGEPRIDIIGNPLYDPQSNIINFKTIPFVDKNRTNNSGEFVCMGPYDSDDGSSIIVCHDPSGKNPQTKTVNENALAAHLGHGDKLGSCSNINPNDENNEVVVNQFYHEKFYILGKKITNQYDSEALKEASEMKSSSNGGLVLGNYSNRNDTISSYNEAMLKNSLISCVYMPDLSDINNNYLDTISEFYYTLKGNNNPGKSDFYSDVTKDKLMFLTFFIKSTDDKTSSKDKAKSVISVFPNPLSGEGFIYMDLIESDRYTLMVYNLQGDAVSTVFENQNMDAGKHYASINMSNIPHGFYFALLKNSRNQKAASFKIIYLGQ